MSAVKSEAMRMIEKLPDECDWDQLAYHFYVRATIQAGLDDIEAGRVVPHEQVMQEMEKWLESYGVSEQEQTSDE